MQDPVPAPGEDAPSVSVVIRTLDEEAHLQECLDRIRSQRHAMPELVVVDSGSTDATLEIAARNQVVLHSIPRGEFTYGRALNQGIARARGDILVIVSAHALPLDDRWLDELVGPLRRSGVAGTFSRQLPTPDADAHVRHALLRSFPPGPENPVVRFSNSSSAVLRSVWRELPFDEELPYCEDLEWAIRAERSGFEVLYCPASKVLHSHNEPLARVTSRTYQEAVAWCRLGLLANTRRRLFGRVLSFFWNGLKDVLRLLSCQYRPADLSAALAFRAAVLAGHARFYREGRGGSGERRDG